MEMTGVGSEDERKAQHGWGSGLGGIRAARGMFGASPDRNDDSEDEQIRPPKHAFRRMKDQ